MVHEWTINVVEHFDVILIFDYFYFSWRDTENEIFGGYKYVFMREYV